MNQDIYRIRTHFHQCALLLDALQGHPFENIAMSSTCSDMVSVEKI